MDWFDEAWLCEADKDWIYSNSEDNSARFVLGKTFEPERSWSNTLLCFTSSRIFL